jgi:putative PIN family toxin of toxin-antitoxin system
MQINKTKIILDTNIWISFLISKELKKIDTLFEKDKIQFVFSNELIEEFLVVVSRPKFEKYFDKAKVIQILNLIEQIAEITTVKSKVSICRDSKDNFLLALAKDAKADYLITGDKDLLVLKTFENTHILSYSDFVNEIK